MKNKYILLTTLTVMLGATNIFAETIVLKTGKTIQAKILERNDDKIKVEVNGIPITYYADQIQSIGETAKPQSTAKNPGAPAQASDPERIIGYIFGQPIPYSELLPPPELLQQQQDKLSPEDLNALYSQYRVGRLTGIVFGTLLEKHVSDNKIQPPTEQEIQEFIAKSREGRPEYAAEVANNKEMQDMERNVAIQFIQSWKINKSLYQQYGGRVIFQQSGPEPIDAYKSFLQEQQRSGSFKFTDKQLENEFWEYFVNDKLHQFLSTTDGAQAMTTPWWLTQSAPADNQQQPVSRP